MKVKIYYQNKEKEYLPRLALDSFGQSITFKIYSEDDTFFDLSDYEVTAITTTLDEYQDTLFTSLCINSETVNNQTVMTLVEGNLSFEGSFKFELIIEKTDDTVKLIIPVGTFEVYD